VTSDNGARDIDVDIAHWFRRRQETLRISATTTTRGGQTIDWIPIESQDDEIATPPPSDMIDRAALDEERPTRYADLDIAEGGPAGHVPILRPDLTTISRRHVTGHPSKQGSLRVNINRKNRRATDPDPAGYFHATSSQWVTCFGCEAWLNVWDPQIDIPSSPGDDHSISQTWLQNYDTPVIHSIEGGLTVDRSLNGDFANHLFTYFTTNGYAADGDNIGGYNTLHAGWRQYHPSIFPGIRINGSSQQDSTQLEIAIKFQLWQGNWWFGFNNDDTGPWIWLGYYPASLFPGGLQNEAQWSAFGGEVYSALANPCGTSDQMGSGRQAADGWARAAYQRSLRYQSNLDGVVVDFSGVPEVDAAASNCATDPYTIECIMNSGSSFGSYQYYGGPTA
jgi:hypothetical protein